MIINRYIFSITLLLTGGLSLYAAQKDMGRQDLNRLLWSAIGDNDIPEMNRLLALRANPNCHDRVGNRPLHIMCRRSLEAVQALLDAKADPTLADQSGETPYCAMMPLPKMMAGEERYAKLRAITSLLCTAEQEWEKRAKATAVQQQAHAAQVQQQLPSSTSASSSSSSSGAPGSAK